MKIKLVILSEKTWNNNLIGIDYWINWLRRGYINK